MKKAIIIGAGPAGLTAAYELLKKTDIKPVVYEATDATGGISQTVKFNGNRIDLGGHRFFSKSDRVMEFWREVLPVENPGEFKQEKIEKGFLIRNRLSRILFSGKLFNYPVRLDLDTLKKLGLTRIGRIGLSYLKARLFPVRNEESLEDFFINRFGKELYRVFFRDYTQKVWGVPCSELPSDWGAQRVKGLSVTKAILQAIRPKSRDNSISQKGIETSLIERFLYPRYGPGQFWEEVSEIIKRKGGSIIKNCRVVQTRLKDDMIAGVSVLNTRTGLVEEVMADYVFSSMPVRELIDTMEGNIPETVIQVSQGLIYRDFMTAGLLLTGINASDKEGGPLKDNWIYIQERDIKAGRLQIYNNWSPCMVRDPQKMLVGMEYFVNEGDEYWRMSDKDFVRFALEELAVMGFASPGDLADSIVVRMPKAYPAYLGTYGRFNEIIEFTGRIRNLYLIGRNGMHRYNNSDHSSLTAMTAVDNIIKNRYDKTNIWEINTENDYHEGE